ncbi:MAG TPA: putative toxin-antitoxin system toxin component, PIN family [Terracidiphilus sp.]
MRIVLETSVLVAAMRSSSGASNALLRLALEGKLKPLISVPLVLEYEAVLTRHEHLLAARMDPGEVSNLVKALCIHGEHIHLARRLRPQLLDPDDEFILETAVHGNADAIVTLNVRDFYLAARSLGIRVWKPNEALKELRTR